MFSRCELNLGVRNTDVNDDLPRTFGDRVGGRLGGDLAAAEEVRLITEITYLRRGPLGDKLTEMSDEPGFTSWLLVNGFGVGDMLIVLVQAPLEKVQVSRLETLAPF